MQKFLTMPFISLMFILFVLLFSVNAYAGDAVLTWDAPTTNTDGTPLEDLAGYKAYWGDVCGTYSNVFDVGMLQGSTVSTTITGLGEGEWCFVVTAYDLVGNESTHSNTTKKNIMIIPTAPSSLR